MKKKVFVIGRKEKVNIELTKWKINRGRKR